LRTARRGPCRPHLLSAYLSIARREIEPARQALLHVLTLDAHHPRALLGLARISKVAA